jgi:hypothetical protein
VSRASSTVTSTPARASATPAASPFGPDPTTTAVVMPARGGVVGVAAADEPPVAAAGAAPRSARTPSAYSLRHGIAPGRGSSRLPTIGRFRATAAG